MYECRDRFDEILIRCYGYPAVDRQLSFVSAPLYNTFVGRMLVDGPHSIAGPIRLRNIRVGRPAVANRVHIGEVVRYDSRTCIRSLDGRRTNAFGSMLRMVSAQHVGRNRHAQGCMLNPPLFPHARVVYIDTWCKLKWCSTDSVAPRSFVWPRSTKEAKVLARTLFVNHCSWAVVFIVRGRSFSSGNACLGGTIEC